MSSLHVLFVLIVTDRAELAVKNLALRQQLAALPYLATRFAWGLTLHR